MIAGEVIHRRRFDAVVFGLSAFGEVLELVSYHIEVQFLLILFVLIDL